MELVIPEATSIVPAGFAKQARARLQRWDDFEDINEARHRLAALEKYVKDRASKYEVQAAARWAEVRIGELLGPAEHGGDRRSESFNSPASELIAPDDRYKFRLLVAWLAIVEECIEEKRKASRKFILDEDQRDEFMTKVVVPRWGKTTSDGVALVGTTWDKIVGTGGEAIRNRYQRLKARSEAQEKRSQAPTTGHKSVIRGAKSTIKKHPELARDLLADPEVRDAIEDEQRNQRLDVTPQEAESISRREKDYRRQEKANSSGESPRSASGFTPTAPLRTGPAPRQDHR